ncbi:unnamed protein product [Spirodela intermedia]|uniref:Uncharacterized protein n=1 Tax=Spirodela intermedia TaxID=51605 RepID=A0A7I8KDC9_SPIIN|nr:unnamed protein product [Spirodela intermedia]
MRKADDNGGRRYRVRRYEKTSASPSSPSLTSPSLVVALANFNILKFSHACEGKSSWPELVGAPGTLAVTIIERQNPLVHAGIVPEGTIVILNFVCNRVRVWVNKAGIVVTTPVIG